MCLQRLAAMLLQVCQNPTQPGFNHYLFESVAALIKYSAAADVSKVAELEEHLFPAFNIVLQQDVQASVTSHLLCSTILDRNPALPVSGCSVLRSTAALLLQIGIDVSIRQCCTCSRHLCSCHHSPSPKAGSQVPSLSAAGDKTVKLTHGLRAQEFHPYVFQIFAQLIELRPAPLPAVYMSIFKPLLAPLFWERPGNVPALTRLLQAYCSKAMAEIMQQGHLEVFSPLPSSCLNVRHVNRKLMMEIMHMGILEVPLPSWAHVLRSPSHR